MTGLPPFGPPLEARLAELRRSIENHRAGAPFAAASVTLLGAGKGQPPEVLEAAAAAGLRDFGENRVQEAAAKWQGARPAGVRLHLIGALQSNKAEQAADLFDVVQTIDRVSLADALAAALEKRGRRLECYLQINTGAESQKGGVAPTDAEALLAHCRARALRVTGLMCIPPHDQPPAPHFALLRAMAQRFGLPNLSMGMSGDYETAIRMGSTCVRIGRALFGERPVQARPAG